jgi:putative flippase GtrA
MLKQLEAASPPLTRVQRVARFLIGGGLNTAVSYLAYLALHRYLSYQLAYLIAYAFGIVFSYSFNSKVVFQKAMSWRGMLAFPAVYVVQYAVSASVLALFVERIGVPAWSAALLVIVLTLPLSYFLTRFVVHRFNR